MSEMKRKHRIKWPINKSKKDRENEKGIQPVGPSRAQGCQGGGRSRAQQGQLVDTLPGHQTIPPPPRSAMQPTHRLNSGVRFEYPEGRRATLRGEIGLVAGRPQMAENRWPSPGRAEPPARKGNALVALPDGCTDRVGASRRCTHRAAWPHVDHRRRSTVINTI